ncbi:MAG: ankyrin repeat domain-containing protein [Gammaproteobacteria bacterium]|nr:ankyrin repeat domain-containing protein [Gammaproteobacteria bacterium]
MQPARSTGLACAVLLFIVLTPYGLAQEAPGNHEMAGYDGLFRAVVDGDLRRLDTLLIRGADADRRDGRGRTPLHVAAHLGAHDAMRILVSAGADPNALDHERYDIVTIAAVAGDLATLHLALELGGRADNVTSPYDGTALIAAAHLGHADAVAMLIAAGAPLDHVNNLGWTALIEAIVLGDGGPAHRRTVEALLDAGADPDQSDRSGRTPLQLAEQRGYLEMADALRAAGDRRP